MYNSQIQMLIIIGLNNKNKMIEILDIIGKNKMKKVDDNQNDKHLYDIY